MHRRHEGLHDLLLLLRVHPPHHLLRRGDRERGAATVAMLERSEREISEECSGRGSAVVAFVIEGRASLGGDLRHRVRLHLHLPAIPAPAPATAPVAVRVLVPPAATVVLVVVVPLHRPAAREGGSHTRPAACPAGSRLPSTHRAPLSSSLADLLLLPPPRLQVPLRGIFFVFFFTLGTGPRRSLSLKLNGVQLHALLSQTRSSARPRRQDCGGWRGQRGAHQI